jgi:hypothetical protein
VRQIGHIFERFDPFFVKPVGDLSGAITRLAQTAKHLLQLFKLERLDVDFSGVRHHEAYQPTEATSNDDNLVSPIPTTRN